MLTEIKEKLTAFISENSNFSQEKALGLLEKPKQFSHGHYSLPVFVLAKELKKAPPLIAKEIAEKMQQNRPDFLEEVQAINGFVNFRFSKQVLQKVLLEKIALQTGRLGFSNRFTGKKLAIDYSSPNVAKPMSIGHLRATVIGQAVRNLAETQGYEVIGINHLGDWGVQFGKLAWAYQNWGEEYPFAEKPFESLYKLYVRFHEEAEENEELNRLGSLTFKKLEEGDPEIEKIWRMFLDISLAKYGELWSRLGIEHDLHQGESFYNNMLKETEKRLEDAGLLEESDGAMVVKLDGANKEMPPCLIRKSDGTSLYATRDLACAIWRKEELGADINLYVVGMDQTLHFNQVFEVLKNMKYEWSRDCHHISFGMYRFKEGRMSTRKGNVIFLEDVLNKSVDLVKKVIEEKNPSLADKEKVAEQVGVGAIIFNDLLSDRVRNVDFDWERVLDFEGASGPYVQYCQVRCRSLIEKFAKDVPREFASDLDEPEEQQLIWLLLQYSGVLSAACDSFKPNGVAQYLLEVCQSFNHFYQKCRVIGEGPEKEASRILLVQCTQNIIQSGLSVLNIESPRAM